MTNQNKFRAREREEQHCCNCERKMEWQHIGAQRTALVRHVGMGGEGGRKYCTHVAASVLRSLIKEIELNSSGSLQYRFRYWSLHSYFYHPLSSTATPVTTHYHPRPTVSLHPLSRLATFCRPVYTLSHTITPCHPLHPLSTVTLCHPLWPQPHCTPRSPTVSTVQLSQCHPVTHCH